MITLLIVGDDRIRRRGYRSLLEGKAGIEILGECNCEDAPERARALRPDVVLLDVTTDGNPDVIGFIHASCSPTKVIVAGVDPGQAAILFWLEHGALQYSPDGAEEAEIEGVIRDVMSGGFHWPGQIALALWERAQELSKPRQNGKPRIPLTPQEDKVHALLARGYEDKEIAEALSISRFTVHQYVHNILLKTSTHSRREAVNRLLGESYDHESRKNS